MSVCLLKTQSGRFMFFCLLSAFPTSALFKDSLRWGCVCFLLKWGYQESMFFCLSPRLSKFGLCSKSIGADLVSVVSAQNPRHRRYFSASSLSSQNPGIVQSSPPEGQCLSVCSKVSYLLDMFFCLFSLPVSTWALFKKMPARVYVCLSAQNQQTRWFLWSKISVQTFYVSVSSLWLPWLGICSKELVGRSMAVSLLKVGIYVRFLCSKSDMDTVRVFSFFSLALSTRALFKITGKPSYGCVSAQNSQSCVVFLLKIRDGNAHAFLPFLSGSVKIESSESYFLLSPLLDSGFLK